MEHHKNPIFTNFINGTQFLHNIFYLFIYTDTATEFLKYYLYNFRFEMIFFITVDILGSGFVNIQQFY